MTGLDKIVEQIRRDAEEIAERNIPVSYTHLDVYKRQIITMEM